MIVLKIVREMIDLLIIINIFFYEVGVILNGKFIVEVFS